MNNLRCLPVACLFLFLFFMVGSGVAQTLDLQKLDALLIQVQAYDWGASREPLMQYTDLERAAYQDPAMVRLVEKKLLTLLKRNASLAAKQFVCQRLSVIGSEASAPTLSKMLKDEKTADMARYALERIPGKKITDALHKALGSSRGLTRIGIINPLGQRAEAGSAAALIKLLNHSDPAVVAASASALGKIGTLAAVAALEQALPKMKTDLLPTALQAMLQAADKLAQTGNASAALTLYKKLQAPDYAAPIRAAALSGQVVTDQAHSQEILLNTLQNADDNQKSMAITLLSRLPAEVKMAPFAALMSRLPAELKVQMLTALAVRGDRSVLSSAVAAVGDADTAVRIAALKSLSALGDASTVSLLAETAAEKSEDEKKAAQESLYLLNAPNVDEAIMQAIGSAGGAVKGELITAVGERNLASATPLLFAAAQDENAGVRLASIKVLGQTAAAGDLPAMIDLLLQTKSEKEQNEAVTALTAVASKIADPDQRAELVLARLAQVKDESGRIALLRVLGRIGASPGLPVLRAALKDKSDEIQVAAIRALSDWPGSEPIDDLKAIAEKSAVSRNQVLALRGFIGLIKNDSRRPEAQSVALFQQALALAREDAEKISVLSGLGVLNSLAALETALGCLGSSGLHNEVGAAVLKLGRKLWSQNPAPVKAAVEQVLNMVDNPVLIADLNNLKARIK